MVVDGLFIIELFQRCAMKQKNVRNDPLFGKIGVLSIITRDLLLLENQVPMIVLKRLFNLIVLEDKLEGGKSLDRLALDFFNHLMPRNKDEMLPEYQHANHLLDLLAKTFHPPSAKNKATSTGKVMRRVTTLRHSVAKEFNRRNSSWKLFLQGVTSKLKHAGVNRTPHAKANDVHPSWKLIPTATELKRAGVKFKKDSIEGSFLKIEFDKDVGVLRIPPIIIEDKTDVLFRNIIASEQFSDGRVTYMTSYAFFIDSLINTASDVAFLRSKGIITNYLGSEEDVSDLFNNLCCEIIIGRFYYSQTCDQLNKYHKRRGHILKATM